MSADIGIDAFEQFTLDPRPSVVFYRKGTYRSDRLYVDRNGANWEYVGLYDGDPMWRRQGTDDAWIINSVVDQFGPLVEAGASDA